MSEVPLYAMSTRRGLSEKDLRRDDCFSDGRIRQRTLAPQAWERRWGLVFREPREMSFHLEANHLRIGGLCAYFVWFGTAAVAVQKFQEPLDAMAVVRCLATMKDSVRRDGRSGVKSITRGASCKARRLASMLANEATVVYIFRTYSTADACAEREPNKFIRIATSM